MYSVFSKCAAYIEFVLFPYCSIMLSSGFKIHVYSITHVLPFLEFPFFSVLKVLPSLSRRKI